MFYLACLHSFRYQAEYISTVHMTSTWTEKHTVRGLLRIITNIPIMLRTLY